MSDALARMISRLEAEQTTAPDLFARVRFQAGDRFIAQGDSDTTVYLITKGLARVDRRDDGSVLEVARVAAPTIVGELAALSKGRTADVTAVDAVDALAIDATAVRDLCLKDPEFARAFKELVSQRTESVSPEPGRRAAAWAAYAEQQRLPQSAKEMLRSVRDQNTEALILRSALDIVHSATGIYRELNPAPSLSREAGWGVIRQKSSLIQAVASLLRAAKSRQHIASIVEDIREHGLQGMPALKMFKGEAALTREDWLERVEAIYKPYLPAALTIDEFDTVRRRFELLQWLDEMLVADGALETSRLPGKSPDEKLRGFLKSQEGVAGVDVFDALDNLFESLMSEGLSRGSRQVVEDLRSVQFTKIRAQVVDPKATIGAELPAGHPCRIAVAEIRRRLLAGEVSAIGGGDYAVQRFPRALLDRIARGAVKVVAFNGTPAAGRAFVVSQFAPAARDLGVQPHYMTTEVQGLDGSGGRTLVTFRTDGTEVVLLTGLGESRLRHNAASILLYERSGHRIPEANLILAAEGIDYVAVIRRDIQRVLAEQPEPQVATQLLILQHPREFEQGLKSAGAELQFASGALFDFFVGHARIDGLRHRFIIPKVGGRGLYGDTAGAFVRACFTAGIPNLSKDVIFNGTAGAFLSGVKPGESLLCPTESIAAFEGEKRFRVFPIESLMRGELAARMRDRVTLTKTHVSVGAPGEETYDLIREFVAKGFESIDVEGASIAEAVAEAGGRFTPIYTFSDNPLHSEHDRYDSLAVMGPFFEGSRFNAGLWDVLQRLIDQ